MKSVDELWHTLEGTTNMPYGPARIAVVEEVIRHADATGDDDLKFSARMYATNAYTHGGDQGKSFVTFSWCLSDFDRAPAPYHRRHQRNLLWHFKFMVTALTKFPEIPLERTYAVLDDMERRYREGGHSLQAVHKHRLHVARHVGDDEAADRYYEQWITAPRDDLSDCIGCDPSTRVSYLSERRRDEEAIALAEPVLAGRLTCTEQPQTILRGLMVPYLRTGHADKAADAHRRGYRLSRGNRGDLWYIGDHIAFCSRTGNEHRGLEILRRHIDWLAEPPSPAAGMTFAANAAQLLRRLTELGHGDAVVARASGDTTVAALGEELAAWATDLGRRFDARNGTSRQGDQIAELIGAEPFEVAVPLSTTARRATPAPVAAPEPEPEPEIPADADAAMLLELAERYEEDDDDAAAAVVFRTLDERFGELTDPRMAARQAMLAGGQHWIAQDLDAAVTSWEKGVALFRSAGTEADLSKAAARLGLVYVLTGRADEGVPLIEADVAYQERHGEPAIRGRALSRRAAAEMVLGRADTALSTLDAADELYRTAGDEQGLRDNYPKRAQCHLLLEQPEAADEWAKRAEVVYRAKGQRGELVSILKLRTHVVRDADWLIKAHTEILASGDEDDRLDSRFARGAALMQVERAGEAIEDFVEAVALSAEADHEQAGAYARFNLARAYQAAGRAGESAEVGEEAVLWLDRIGDSDTADNARLSLANVYRQLGANEDALARYDELIERLAGNPAGRGQIREYAGDLLYAMDRDALAADKFAEAAEDLRVAEDPLAELRVMRRRSAALRWAGDLDRALEVARDTEVRLGELVAAGLDDEAVVAWERATLAFDTAGLLAARGELEEALYTLGDAPEQLREYSEPGHAEQAEQLRAQLAKDLNDR